VPTTAHRGVTGIDDDHVVASSVGLGPQAAADGDRASKVMSQ
jgi:hypothetical protein